MNTSTIRGTAVQGKLMWAGISLNAVVGLIHLIVEAVFVGLYVTASVRRTKLKTC